MVILGGFMGEHISAPFRLFLIVLACVLFFVAAVAWQPPIEPYRSKLIAAGLFCWAVAQFF
jgi:hypothetical protein